MVDASSNQVQRGKSVIVAIPVLNGMAHIDFRYPLHPSVKTTDIPERFSLWRIQNTATVYRTERAYLGGGFGNPQKQPPVWAVAMSRKKRGWYAGSEESGMRYPG